MSNEGYLYRIVAEEFVNLSFEPTIWQKALEETGFSDDGATRKAYLRLRVDALRADEEHPILSAGLADELLKAKEGDAESQFKIAKCLGQVDGEAAIGPKLRWLRAAAKQGHIRAQAWLGYILCSGWGNFAGSMGDCEEGTKWLRLAAEANDASAQHYLWCWVAGHREDLVSTQEGVSMLRRSAENGYAEAQFQLGRLCSSGEDVPKNQAEAFYWYRCAAEQGNKNAAYSLACAYDLGEGVQQNHADAFVWYLNAAKSSTCLDSTEAGDRIARMYYAGEGVPKNYIEAFAWFWYLIYFPPCGSIHFAGLVYEDGRGCSPDYLSAAVCFLGTVTNLEKTHEEARQDVDRMYRDCGGAMLNFEEDTQWMKRVESRAKELFDQYSGSSRNRDLVIVRKIEGQKIEDGLIAEPEQICSYAVKAIGRPVFYLRAGVLAGKHSTNKEIVGCVLSFASQRKNRLLDAVQANPKRFVPQMSAADPRYKVLFLHKVLEAPFVLVTGESCEEVKAWVEDFWDEGYDGFFHALAFDENGVKIAGRDFDYVLRTYDKPKS